MESPLRPTRAVLALAAALILTLAGCSSEADDDAVATATTTASSLPESTTTGDVTTTTDAPFSGRTITIDLAEDELAVEGCEEPVARDTSIRLVVTLDQDDTIHVHGYEQEVEVRAGTPAVLDFQADLPGRWEIELHGLGEHICELTVEG